MNDPIITRNWAAVHGPLACVLALLLMPAGPARALDPNRTIYQYSCRSWDRQSGLPANGINAILQTTDGYLWFGTALGLVRFDGGEFKLFDMSLSQAPSTIVTSLAMAKSGGLWFGLGNGAFGFCDGDTVSFRGREAWGGLGLNVHSILEDSNGDLWIAAETQLGRLTRTNRYEARLTGRTANERYDVTALAQGSRGRIWLGTSRRGLYSWQNGVLTKFPDPMLDNLTIRSLTEDAEGAIWVGTQSGLLCYEADGQKKPLPFPWYETRALLADRNGIVWVGTSGGGLIRYENDQYTAFCHSNGLADDFVTALAEDREGSLWVGTRRGLNQLSDVKIPTFGRSEGLASDVNVGVSASARGGLWIAGGDNITYFDGSAHIYYSTNLGLANGYVKCLFEARNGDLYAGDGAMNVNVISGYSVVARYPARSWPMGMAETDDGVVVGVGGELCRVGRDHFEPYPFDGGQKPAFGWIFNLVSDTNGALWISCDAGVCRVQGHSFRMWTKDDGLPNSVAMWVCLDDEGVVWAGFKTGMARLKNGRVSGISRNDGLFDSMIYAIVPDDHGYLWVDSSRGIFKASRTNLNAFCDGVAKRVECIGYDGLDAVKTDEKIQYMQSGCKTLDGRIWFPTAEGILMINPTNISSSRVPPEVHLQMVKANGRSIDRARPAIVPPGQGELQFYYSGLSFIAPKKTSYRYQLVGYDAGWVDAESRRSAFYTNLKPGKYVFRVEACNADGIWSNPATSQTIDLRPHFYQTRWAMAAAGILFAASAIGVGRWRNRHLAGKHRQLQQANDLLETKVRDRTAELAANNVSLKNEIEERKRMELEVERIHRQLVDASRMAGQAEVASSVLHNVGNVLNSVNVSASIAADRVRTMRLENLSRAAQLLRDNRTQLHRFLVEDQRGQHLPDYFEELASQLARERNDVLRELGQLSGNIDHIKEIVNMQQAYARIVGVQETIPIQDVVEGALRMHIAAYRRHAVQVVRQYQDVPPVTVDRHRVLQILVNLLHNAKYACDDSRSPDKQVTVRIRGNGQRVNVDVVDNGIGIPPENLTRIFSHGFTTRKNGHGFGLHSAALAASELGGVLTVHSDGPGKGATFSLEIPAHGPVASSATGA